MTRVTRDSIGYLVVIGFSILLLTWAIPTYTPAYPGYGASPALVANVAVGVMLFMACLSLLRVIVAVRLGKQIPAAEREFPQDLKDDGGFTQVGRVNLRHLAGMMLPCAFLVVAIEYLGYEIASFLFLMILQFVIGCRRWLQAAILSLVLVAVLFVIMRYGFGVPVPGPQYFL